MARKIELGVKLCENESRFNLKFNHQPPPHRKKKEKYCPYGRKYISTDDKEISCDRQDEMSANE